MKLKLAFALLSVLFTYHVNAQNSAPFVIPKLQEWTGNTGFYTLKSTINLVVDDKLNDLLTTYVQTFANDLKAVYPKRNIRIKTGKPQKGDIYFHVDNNSQSIASEGYELQIADYLTIHAKTPLGAFWATRTILQILAQDPTQLKIPKGIAKDFPKYEVRSFVLDVGRKFFTIDFLRNYVKLLSYYKMNDFQIHLNDNGFKQFFNNDWSKTYSAFRLENATYPGLTAKDGSYSKKEFIDLQKLGNTYGVTIVPEIDAPAHALSITKAVPEIASDKYGADHLDITKPKTYEVVHNIFKEYLQGPNPVFINEEVHIGTDEYAKAEAENFRKFTDSTIKYVESFGKRVRLWGALTHAKGQTPVKSTNVTMNLWYNGYAEPAEMFKLGYKGISTPDGWLYIVPKAGYYYDYLNLKNIYQKWAPNVIGKEVFSEDNKQIRGGAFAVWNDHVGNGITQEDVTDRVFPALQVLSQKMWIGNTADSLMKFEVFNGLSKQIGEGPGLNLRGKVNGKDSLVLQYDFTSSKSGRFTGKKKPFQTTLNEIGYDYTVSFTINPSAGNPANAVIFSSPKAIVKLKQLNTSMLGFSREGYDYNFNYTVPENVWTKITITGNNKGTSLYVNGVFVERLEGAMQSFANTKDKIAKVQTLFFPLKYIGDTQNSFKGAIGSLKVFNKVLTDKLISKL
ncbi:family 20 glycosylhydrolase [Pedobacter insulae]|uniref:Hexosaminidase n=1 Tax=Pedobacter insulae TaxID=414048 RepID=A0A1I2WHH1_9SPHI|nr:family 20 glycosylhydrolase [Pedobacter insulae]SFH00802.1 hexosaminidase [Pedobacter insulae]